MINLFLLCLSVHLISANPLAKILLQAKKNSNGFSNYNAPSQTCNVQPYPSSSITQNPSANTWNQQYVPQNGFPIQINPEDISHSYLNKLLANSKIQSILNPNANGYNQNNNDFPTQSNTGQTPNIINNYYIIPPESLQGNEHGIEIIKNLIENQAVITGHNRMQINSEHERRTQKPKDEGNVDLKRQQANKRINKDGNSKNNNNNNQRRRRKKTGGLDTTNNNNKPDQKINRNMANQKRTNVKVNNERNSSQNNSQNDQSSKSSEKPRNKKRKRPRNKSNNTTTVSEWTNNTGEINNDTVTTRVESEPKHKQRKQQADVSITSKDEAVIRDIHEKFPRIPENVIRRLLRYLKRQLKNQISDNCEAKCNRLQAEIRNNGKRGNDRNNQNKRRKLNSDSVKIVKVTTSLPVTTTFASTTTDAKEVSTTQEENTTVNDGKNVKESTTEYKETEIVDTTTNHELQTPKIGEEVKITDLKNNVDDYFPDFRFDKMYTSEDDYIRSFRDNRLFYTTDRNYGMRKGRKDESTEIYYEPFAVTRNINKQNRNDYLSDDIEQTLTRPAEDGINKNNEEIIEHSEEEIEFQTPPYLENPDFETKPVVKYYDFEHPIYNKKDNVNVKSSTYSNAKKVGSSLKGKTNNDKIETVYAGSKVANYGKSQDLEEDQAKNLDNSEYDDTILVYARTMSD